MSERERERRRERERERGSPRLVRSILNCMVLFCDNRVSIVLYRSVCDFLLFHCVASQHAMLCEVESTALGLAVMQCGNCSPSTALNQ